MSSHSLSIPIEICHHFPGKCGTAMEMVSVIACMHLNFSTGMNISTISKAIEGINAAPKDMNEAPEDL